MNKSRELFHCDMATARQVIEAGAGSMLGRRYRDKPVRPHARWKGRGWRRRGRDRTGFGLVLGVLAMAALLAWFKPYLPWLPGRVRSAFLAIERVGG